jgi:NAD+ synthetase
MAISNKLGHLVLSTGNKSELAVGYCTLYGDMAGGLAVIGDLPKTLVYQLSQFVNRKQLLIPERILSRPPTAELRDDQKDEDSLPPYDELDPLLHDMVVERLSTSELCAKGHLPERIREVRRLLIGAEYKRRQAAPTLRVSPRAFGEGWRFPIAHRFRAASDDFLPGPEGAAE